LLLNIDKDNVSLDKWLL